MFQLRLFNNLARRRLAVFLLMPHVHSQQRTIELANQLLELGIDGLILTNEREDVPDAAVCATAYTLRHQLPSVSCSPDIVIGVSFQQTPFLPMHPGDPSPQISLLNDSHTTGIDLLWLQRQLITTQPTPEERQFASDFRKSLRAKGMSLMSNLTLGLGELQSDELTDLTRRLWHLTDILALRGNNEKPPEPSLVRTICDEASMNYRFLALRSVPSAKLTDYPPCARIVLRSVAPNTAYKPDLERISQLVAAANDLNCQSPD